MSKKICKLVKDKLQKDEPEKYKSLIKEPKYFCKNCGRAAVKASHLCDPKKL